MNAEIVIESVQERNSVTGKVTPRCPSDYDMPMPRICVCFERKIKDDNGHRSEGVC